MLRTYLFDTYTADKARAASRPATATRGSYRTPPSVGATNLLVAPGRARAPTDLLAGRPATAST